jgi:hypothetical protein
MRLDIKIHRARSAMAALMINITARKEKKILFFRLISEKCFIGCIYPYGFASGSAFCCKTILLANDLSSVVMNILFS